MPRKQKSKSKLKIAALATFGLVLIAAVTAQVWYNLYVWNATQEHAAFKMGTLIKTAIDNLDDIKTDLGNDGRIEELRLQLPAQNDDVDDMRYLYFDNPQHAQVTSRLLVTSKTSQLLTQRNTDDLFEAAPGTQACSRGFTLRFSKLTDDSDTLRLSGTRNLNDGRTLYVYRETTCDTLYGLNELEAHLLQAQSY